MKTYSDLGDKFRNPVLFADYSDPDVIRAGDTFYMTASSFNYTPGLPILVSKDLVNWSLVNYALKNIGQERFKIPRHSEGIWAPAIRFHEGMFYIYYGMPDEGYYVVRTKDPLGEWEEPVLVLEGKGLIDPCPFWDEDGRAYIIHGYAKSRIGFKSILGIFEMSPDGLKAISEDHFVFNGNDPSHPAVTIEGPKVYKRDGFYYILAPAGGVREGYQVALRSKDIHGPYEIKTVMAQGGTVINGPHQGGLIDTPDGKEYFLHFQDRGLYGRICHLQPVCWKGGWPVIGINPDENGVGEPAFELDKPVITSEEPVYLEGSDDFKDGKPNLSWQWMGDHDDSFYGSVTDETGAERDGLRLFCQNPSHEEMPVLWRSSNVLTQKLIYPSFRAEAEMDASGLLPGERAGVCMTGGQYVAAFIEKDIAGKYYVRTIHSEGDDTHKSEATDLSELFENYVKDSELSLEDALKNIKWVMTFTGADTYFQNVTKSQEAEDMKLKVCISFDGVKMFDLGIDYTPSDHTWVGAKLGIFALSLGGNNKDHGHADFKNFIVEELQ
ncbi:glycoside hydrolase family 43 protein [Butyrivibrio sp. NC2007]|uniref:glycoside hydrolase family 43 protein n=1 Tax=Butyrivibrio sp. NC2007 TaxID=1280683 RepID=UPI0003B518C7|nr:glycoside hydrolase 43 family protein [Butyrivibrio sp. NC2007]